MKTVIINDKEVRIHDEFEYFQPNIHIDGDCVIRALCKAQDWAWKKAYCYAFISTIKDQYMPNCKDGERILYKSLGYTWHSHNSRKKRPTVAEFAREHQEGTYVLALSKHAVCVKDGSYYDIWDSGSRKLYGYWEKSATSEESTSESRKGDPQSETL